MSLKQLYESTEKMKAVREGKPEIPVDTRKDPWSAHRQKKDDTFVNNSFNSEFKPEMGRIAKKMDNGHEFKKGALEPDVFYAGLEDEIRRVAKLMSDVK
jgi:hypothetical protein